MKTFSTFFLFLISFTITAQIVNIPDDNFKAYLVGNTQINTNGDAEIQVSEANSFAGNIDCSNVGISVLNGIESFVNIQSLNVKNNFLENIDISKNINLKILDCSSNNLEHIDLSKNINLENLDSGINKLIDIDFSKNINLKYQSLVNNI